MTVWHAEYAWLGRTAADVLIETEGQEIVSVEEGAGFPANAEHLAGLTMPGMANAHCHAFHRALRGRSEGLDFWSWREEMYALADRLDPGSYHQLARATYAEMALAGITAVGEFHYLHHGPEGKRYDDPNEMAHALAAAASEAGIRLTLLDACYLRDDFDRPASGVQLRFSDGDAEAWAQRAGALRDTELLNVGFAAHSVRALDVDSLRAVKEGAAARGAPLHVHVSEQRAENERTLAATGMTPVELLEEAGYWDAGAVGVHATHLTDQDLRLLGASGTRVCLCPTTERDLGDGIGPAGALVAAGARLCLGSDSNVVVDLLEEARLVEQHERLATGQRGVHKVARLLDAATAGGAAALGWRSGRLEPGALADFVTIALDSPRAAGGRGGDPARHVAASATAPDVTSVVVGGRQIVRQGQHFVVGDLADVLDEAVQAVMGDR